jgi:hypothetical protein
MNLCGQQICFAVLVLLVVALSAPPASAAPVPQLRKLAQLPGGMEGNADIIWDAINCRSVVSHIACDGVTNLPSAACCNEFGCRAHLRGCSWPVWGWNNFHRMLP